MPQAAAAFEGRHDFARFHQKDPSRGPERDTVRTIRRIEVVDEGAGQCRIDMQLDGALYKMVRNVVGCIVYAALGRVSLEDVREALQRPSAARPSRCELGEFPCLPASGLCLERVHYAAEDDF
ncbi:unnamed protein product [Prorocentrum cordatum]|uniref:tRNA pseudouridine synthase n=2 Tax=Prorocentrum cordatum TaxID=2364126 RepID=A0ABN9WKR7_9DINO|nr:unnamed protein product [Polarella glacialis]